MLCVVCCAMLICAVRCAVFGVGTLCVLCACACCIELFFVCVVLRCAAFCVVRRVVRRVALRFVFCVVCCVFCCFVLCCVV